MKDNKTEDKKPKVPDDVQKELDKLAVFKESLEILRSIKKKEKKKDIEIMDISGKDSLECPNCGLVSKIPSRTVSMEELKHFQDNERFMKWQLDHGIKSQGFANVRIAICPQCQQVMICKDQFTIEKKE